MKGQIKFVNQAAKGELTFIYLTHHGGRTLAL